MTQFIEITDNAGNHHLINVSFIASVEDRRKSIILHFVNNLQPAMHLSMSYEAFKDGIKAGNPIIPAGSTI